MTKKESAATDGVIESDERALCTGDSNGEISSFRSAGQTSCLQKESIRVLEIEKAQKRVKSNSQWYGR